MAARRVGDSYGGYRSRLVEQLRASGVRDLSVLRAFGETPRHLFVPEAVRHQAYDDVALPIGNGQTISQPSTQARYLEALDLSGVERVLEIGTGSGYQAALLSYVVAQAVTVERICCARFVTLIGKDGFHADLGYPGRSLSCSNEWSPGWSTRSSSSATPESRCSWRSSPLFCRCRASSSCHRPAFSWPRVEWT